MDKKEEGRLIAVIADHIRKYLEANKMTQKELAERSGVRPTTLNNWLRCSANPRIDNLEKIAEALHVRVSDLVEEDASKPYLRVGEYHLLSLYNSDREFRIFVEYGESAAEGRRLSEINRLLGEKLKK